MIKIYYIHVQNFQRINLKYLIFKRVFDALFQLGVPCKFPNYTFTWNYFSVIEQVLQTWQNWLYGCVEEMMTFLKNIGANDYKIPDMDKIVCSWLLYILKEFCKTGTYFVNSKYWRLWGSCLYDLHRLCLLGSSRQCWSLAVSFSNLSSQLHCLSKGSAI